MSKEIVDEKKETEMNTEEMVNSALQDPAMKKRFEEEVAKASKEQTERAILASKILDYDDERLDADLGTFKKLSPKKYEDIVNKRNEVISNIDDCSIDKLKEINQKLEIARNVEEEVRKHRELDRKKRESSVPLIDENSSSSELRHKEFTDIECRNLRDIFDDSCVEASLTWTKELNDYRKKRPFLDREILSEII